MISDNAYRIHNIIIYIILVVCLLSQKYTFGGIDYVLYALYLLFSLTVFKFKIRFPKRYIFIFVAMLGIMAVNAFVSPYSPPIMYVVIASLITSFPFINYIISYNYKFSDNQIIKYINNIIVLISIVAGIFYVETFVLGVATIGYSAIISSELFMLGFFASICNQGVILALASYKISQKKNSLRIAYFLSISIFLTMQFKAIAGLILIWVAYIFINSKNKVLAVCSTIVAGLFAIVILLNVSAFTSKLAHYNNLYLVATDGIARVELYKTAFEIVDDHFPLGTGQGTYGSIPVNIVGSRVYADYGIDKVWGLGEDDGVDFKMDTHWSAILGEMGVLGTMLYLILLFYPIMVIRKKYRCFPNGKYYLFIISTSIIVLSIESITLTLINQFGFMVIYTGLSAIIIRRINEYYQNESITSNNQLSNEE